MRDKILPVLLVFCLFHTSYGVAAQDTDNDSLEAFLGESYFVTQQLWEGRGGTSILIAQNGTVIAFHGRNDMIRISEDGGETWQAERSMGGDVTNGNALLDETNGDILFLNPGSGGSGQMMRSSDHGETWVQQDIDLLPDGFGLYPDGVGNMQAGITLKHGYYEDRLIMPSRIMGPKGIDSVGWRSYHYSAALYSDDGGKTWQTSKPFPVMGTAGGALAELLDGSMVYNAREFLNKGNRFIAQSSSGGDLWLNTFKSPVLPDGPGGSSYGCTGGLIRLPVEGHNILVYSNLDTDAGTMPDELGDSSTAGRENITVWASFDGGKTWPVKRLVFDGPSGNSTLGVGRPGTPTEGKIYLLYEGGQEGSDSAVQLAAFNLSWLLNGKDVNNYLIEEYSPWTVYDGGKLLEDADLAWSKDRTTDGVTDVDTSVLASIVDDPDIEGNKLIKMEDLSENTKESWTLNWQLGVPGQGVTILFRSKPTEGILDFAPSSGKDGKFFYLSVHNAAYKEAVALYYPDYLEFSKSGLTATYSQTDWTVYRLNMRDDSVNLYINENPIPVLAGKTPKEKSANELLFGDNTKEPFGSYFDWLIWTKTGAFAPGEDAELPDYLTGLSTYALNLEVNPPESGDVSGGGEYLAGRNVGISASANNGFEFEGWTCQGNTITSDSAYTYTMPAEDITLSANFVESTPSGIETLSMNAGIYPNPATHMVHIKAQPGARVTVFNQIGNVMSQFVFDGEIEYLNIKHYPAGMYVFRFESKGHIGHVKLIKR